MNGVLREQAQSFLTLYGYLPSKKATVPWKDVAGCMALFAERLILRCCGPIEADRLAREVRVHGQLCPMRPRCFDLLVFFLENQGVMLTREALLAAVWNMREHPAPVSGNIDFSICALRAALGPGGPLLRTIRGKGYMLTDREQSTEDSGHQPAERKQV